MMFEQCLCDYEFDWLQAYRQKFPGRAWSLNQNPDGRSMKSSAEGTLQTIIRNVHLVWADAANPDGSEVSQNVPTVSRWLTATELLLTQGFPAFPHLYGHMHCSFAVDRTHG